MRFNSIQKFSRLFSLRVNVNKRTDIYCDTKKIVLRETNHTHASMHRSPTRSVLLRDLCHTRRLLDFHQPVVMASNPIAHRHLFHHNPYHRMAMWAQPMMDYTIPILGMNRLVLAMFRML